MAVNTNSKGYQSLINSGYTDEQIGQMQEEVLSGKSAKEVIANNPAPNGGNKKSQSTMVDPIAFRPEYNNGQYDKYIEGWDPTKLNNADINISQYGDDSSSKNYNNSALWGGENQKYTGENTLGSQIAYNPNATVAGLDPNYKYGQAAQMQNSQQANYIATRNDEIASALYNEGLTSIQDVANFLSTQAGWDYSNENERQNTIQSVWKRIGQIAAMNGDKEPAEEPDLSKAEEILSDNEGGKIYGKTTAETGELLEGIDTIADANSVYRAMEEGRVANLKALVSMNVNDIAVSIHDGINPYGEQAWRDLKQYYPEVAKQVEAELKKLNTQDTVNAISSGSELPTNTDGTSTANNDIVEFASSNSTSIKSSVEITKDVHNSLAENQTANEASETMAVIEEDMATLKNRLKNLRAEANKAFKGDVPDYLVNAYINNKTQEIQNQMSILEDRYNAAYNRYKTELANTQWQKEYELKVQELQLQKQAYALNKYATEQGIAIDWYKALGTTTGTATTNAGDTYQVTTMSDEQVGDAVDQLLAMYDNGQLGNAQCAAGIQKYYLPLLGISLPNLSSFENKKKLINEGSDYTPKKGDLIILSSKSAPSNGHIGIVLGVSDGTIQYLDWNGSLGADGKGTEKVAINGISATSSSIQGFRNVNKGQGMTYVDGESETGYYDPAYAEIYGKYLQGKFAAGKQLQTQASAMGLTVQELDAQAKAWKNSQNNNTAAQTRLHAIEQVLALAGDNRNGRLFSQLGISEYINEGYADFNAAYDFIRDNITFDKLLDLKKNGATFGALSNQELEAIGNAALNLNKRMSNEEFQRQLTWIYNELLRGMGESGNLTTQEIINRYNSDNKIDTNTSADSTPNTNRGGSSSGGTSAEEKAKAVQGL